MGALPPLSDRWVVAALGHSPEGEARADCARCDRCTPDGPGTFFHPVSRCCTYTPELANFLVGGALVEGGPGAESLRARIRTGPATRLGLGRDAAWDQAYAAAKAAGQFGRDQALRCPHHQDDGGCGVWRWRDAVCATWFCRHERGAVGQARWQALREWLMGVQDTVAAICAETAQGTFEGREEAFYRDCVAIAEGLDWDSIRHRGGPSLRDRTASMRERWSATDPPLPAWTTWSSITTGSLPDGRVRIFGYNKYDPVDLDAAAFDGERELSREETRKLLDFRVIEEI